MIKQNKTKNRNKEEQITEQTRDAGKKHRRERQKWIKVVKY